MPASPGKAARKRLGDLLIRRRVELDPRFRNRAEFQRATGIDYRLIQDLETGAMNRQKYAPSTIALFEHAYRWEPGSFMRVLAGGDPVTLTRRPSSPTA